MNTSHYSTGSGSVGPVNEQEFLRLVRAGDSGPNDLVRGGDLADGMPSREVPGLLPPVPPHRGTSTRLVASKRPPNRASPSPRSRSAWSLR